MELLAIIILFYHTKLSQTTIFSAVNICKFYHFYYKLHNRRQFGPAYYKTISLYGYMPDWDVTDINVMDGLFYGSSFNEDITEWNVSNVVSMKMMFQYACEFNQPIQKWNTSNVFDMRHMFLGATSFNQPLDNWDLSDASIQERFQGLRINNHLIDKILFKHYII